MMTVVALGTFDGVHLGHKALFDRTNEIASSRGLSPLVFTFSDNPANSLTPYHPVRLITPKREKLRRIKSIVRNVYCMDFADCSDMTAREFFVFLVNKFNARHFVCGFNFSFGKGREGTPETLKLLCAEFGFGCDIVDGVTDGETVISSTNIRRLITMGRIAKANSLLTEPYSVTSRVVHGKKVGRRIGFPTLNQRPDKWSVRPSDGVYITLTTIKGKTFTSVTDIGVCPTYGDRTETIETHVLRRSAGIPKNYSGNVTVTFLNRIRDEMRFESEKELKDTIKSDICAARVYFKKNKIK